MSGFVFCPHCGARVDYTPSVRQVLRDNDRLLRIQFYDVTPLHKCKGGAA